MNFIQKRQLRAQAHALKPIIRIGEKGLTPSVLKAIDQALFDHELIKIRIVIEEKKDFLDLAKAISEQLLATLIQTMGRIATLYRPSKKPHGKKKRT